MNDLKASRYITEIDVGGSVPYLLFSSLFGRLVEIPSGYRPAAKDLLQAPDSLPSARHAELQQTLLEQGLLIPGEFDELQHLIEQYRQAKFVPGPMLGLTICPTLACNFRCTYCYQKHPAGRMSAAVQDRLVAYVHSVKDLRSLSITWFGGEPLQALGIIEKLSSRFRQGDYRYTGNMVTNGSRLTADASRRLVEVGVNWIQVTLDGPREIHDARRLGADGQGTFDAILGNLQQAGERLAVTLRVNVDRRNIATLPHLFDQLDAAGLRGRVVVYFAPVTAYTEVCADVTDHCLPGPEWASLETQLTFLASVRGYASITLPTPRTNVCLSDRAGDFVVVPSGMVFKCWNDVTDSRRAVFDLTTMSSSKEMAEELARWTEWEPFKFDECRSCPVLPLCLAGCPSVGMRQNKGACVTLKRTLQERVLLYYLSAKRREQAESIEKLFAKLPASGPTPQERRVAAVSVLGSGPQSTLARKIISSLESRG